MASTVTLTTPERRLLANREQEIEGGLRSFFTVAEALADIRDRKLYRDGFTTFELYCKERWKFTSSRARQLLGGYEAAKTVESVTTVTVDNERTARVLASLETPQQQATVWAKAVETAPKDKEGNPKPTAAHVAKVAKSFQHPSAAIDEPPSDTSGPEPAGDANAMPAGAKKEPNTIGEAKEAVTDFLNELIAGKPPHFLMAIADHLQDMAGVLRA